MQRLPCLCLYLSISHARRLLPLPPGDERGGKGASDALKRALRPLMLEADFDWWEEWADCVTESDIVLAKSWDSDQAKASKGPRAFHRAGGEPLRWLVPGAVASLHCLCEIAFDSVPLEQPLVQLLEGTDQARACGMCVQAAARAAAAAGLRPPNGGAARRKPCPSMSGMALPVPHARAHARTHAPHNAPARTCT